MDPSNPWVVLVGVLAGVGCIIVSPLRRPFFYVWRRLVGEPLAAWFDSIVTAVVVREVKEPDGNGGHNLADLARGTKANHIAIVSLETTMHAFGERLQEVGRKSDAATKAAERADAAAVRANQAAVKAQSHTEELIAELSAVNGAGRKRIIDRRDE